MTTAAELRAPWHFQLARVALWYAVVVSALLALAMPLPPAASTSERATAFVLGTVSVVALFSVVMLTRRRRAGWATAIGLGLLGAQWIVVRGGQVFGPGHPRVQAMTMASLIISGSLAFALVLAMLCCFALGDWRWRLT